MDYWTHNPPQGIFHFAPGSGQRNPSTTRLSGSPEGIVILYLYHFGELCSPLLRSLFSIFRVPSWHGSCKFLPRTHVV